MKIKHEKHIKQWNAVTYLREFIDTALALNAEEERALDYIRLEAAEREENNG